MQITTVLEPIRIRPWPSGVQMVSCCSKTGTSLHTPELPLLFKYATRMASTTRNNLSLPSVRDGAGWNGSLVSTGVMAVRDMVVAGNAAGEIGAAVISSSVRVSSPPFFSELSLLAFGLQNL